MVCKIEAHQREDGDNPSVGHGIHAGQVGVDRHVDPYIETYPLLYHFRVVVLEAVAGRKWLCAEF